jgi:AbrB family looped-hinge helix DNA binding protein
MQEVLSATLNNEGRLVIPAVYRKELGLKSGQKVMVKLTQEGLLITTFDRALKGFQDDVASLAGSGQTSLVQELLAERQIEASKEASG